MKSRSILLFLAGALLLAPLQLAAQAEQAKVLLPPEVGYKNLRLALYHARQHFKKKEFKKAFELFKKCSEVKHLNDQHRSECLWYAGWSAEKGGDLKNAAVFYKKTLSCKEGKFRSNAVKSLRGLTTGKNLIPDSSFEKNTSAAWNRMIDQDYLPGKAWVRDSSTAFQGKYSLRSTGKKPLILMTEGFCAPGVFSCAMKSEASQAKVCIEIFSYSRFAPLRLASKEFTLSAKWNTFRFSIPKKYLRFEKGTAPLFCRITPLTEKKMWVDSFYLAEGKNFTYKEFLPVTISLAEAEKLLSAPPRVTFAEHKLPAQKKNLQGEWSFSVTYPVKAARVPVEMALPLPQGKWFTAENMTVRCADGKILPVQSRILGRWPKDGSIRSVLFSFEADLKKGSNSFFIRPGKGPAVSKAPGPIAFTLTAQDAHGASYLSQKVKPVIEFQGSHYTCYLFRGAMVRNKDALALYEVRQKIWHASGVTEISALIKNPHSSMLVLKNAALHFESGKAGKKVRYHQYFDRTKQRFAHPVDGKCGYVQGNGGTLLMREASLRHPVKLELSASGKFTAHLWPEDLRSLILSRKTVLHREFVYTPQKGKEIPDRLGYRSIGLADSKYFAQSRFFIIPTGSWRKDQPYFKKYMGDYGYFFSGEAQRVFNYKGRFLHGMFNYGDVYGDGGWGNMESYLDFAEMIYAVSMNEHAPFGWALNRARHYRDMDIAGGVCCYHSSNHSGGVGYDFSHSWPQGVLYHYLLTGDLRSLDVIKEVIANYTSHPIDYKYIQGSRSLGRYLLGLADFYGFTGDPAIKKRFIEQIRYTEKHELGPKFRDQTIFRWHGRLDPFHAWYGCCAMMEIFLLTGDKRVLPTLRREMKNSLNMDFYRNDLKEKWPGAPLHETLPIHAGYLSRHRGALFYPLMKFYSELTGDKKYLRLGQLSAYAAFLPGLTKSWPMDSFRLAVLDGTSEKALLKEVLALQRKAAARTILNGDFSKSPDWYTHWHLPAGRQMSYDDAVKLWPLKEKKEFPKLIHEYLQRKHLVSPWRGYSRNFAWMDHKKFGEKAPSLRVTLSSKWSMGKGCTLACAPIYAEPGTYRFSGVFNFEKGIGKNTDIFLWAVPEGEIRSRVSVSLQPGVSKPAAYHPQNFLTGMKNTVKPWKKSGWQKFEFVFTAKKKCVLTLQFNFKLNRNSPQAHGWVDDIKFERIKK